MTQKLVRAVESENQLEEVMTDFWYNHFNVSLTDNKARPFLLSYERDAIRPHALGNFRDLLEATAKSPAMLVYLDNAQSTAAADEPTTMQDEMGRMPRRRPASAARAAGRFGGGGRAWRASAAGPSAGRQNGSRGRHATTPRSAKPHGVNENYARELMELHTLGVDGGYTQQDVVQVARAFTGWTILPVQPRRARRPRRGSPAPSGSAASASARRGTSSSAPTSTTPPRRPSSASASRPAGGSRTARRCSTCSPRNRGHRPALATKLAVRFVSDHPSPALVDRLTDVYLKTGGDVRRMLAAIVESPEFWSRDAVGAKIKSPFELAASALRVTGGDIIDPRELLQWITRMGQPLYAYQAPTGYPDRAEAWVNTGSLLNRMNFGLQLAANRVKGVSVDLPRHQPGAASPNPARRPCAPTPPS